MINICDSCGGVIGRDCFNPIECAQITANLNNYQEQPVFDNKFKEAVELLRSLADIQNGAPLVRDEKEWNNIMEDVYSFLNEYEPLIKTQSEQNIF